MQNLFHNFNSSPEVIRLPVMMYIRFLNGSLFVKSSEWYLAAGLVFRPWSTKSAPHYACQIGSGEPIC